MDWDLKLSLVWIFRITVAVIIGLPLLFHIIMVIWEFWKQFSKVISG